MIREFIKSFFLIFMAEMGDKTQIMAMSFATQYSLLEVLGGVFIGVILNHGIAILLGKYFSTIVPEEIVQISAGFIFIVFGIMTLMDEKKEKQKKEKTFGPILTVALAFFVGEFGDKTQLSAMALSAEGNHPIFVLMGTVSGMMATSSLGIFVGRKIGEKMPDISIKIMSSFIFLMFGLFKIWDITPNVLMSWETTYLFSAISILIYLLFLIRQYKRMKSGQKSEMKEVASKLYLEVLNAKEAVDDICLGEEGCSDACRKEKCLIWSTQRVLQEAVDKGVYFKEKDISPIYDLKKYDLDKVVKALSLIIKDYKKYGVEKDKNFVINRTRENLEMVLFNKYISFNGNIDSYLYNVKAENENVYRKIRENMKDAS